MNSKFTILLLWGMVFLFSCKDQESASPELSSQDAKDLMLNLAEQGQRDITMIESSEGFQRLNDASGFFGVDLLLGMNATEISHLGQKMITHQELKIESANLSKVFDYLPNKEAERGDEFESWWGVYNYVDSLGDFVRDPFAIVNYVQFNFPSAGAISNNSSLKINSFERYSYFYGGVAEMAYFESIKSFQAELKVNEALVASIDLSAEYNQDQIVSIDLDLFLSPFDLIIRTLAEERKITNTLSFNADGVQLLSYNLIANFDRSISNIDTQMTYIAGEVQYRDYSLAGQINLLNIQNTITPSANTLNEEIDLTIFFQEKKLGELYFEFLAEEELLIYLQLNDGDKLLINDMLS